MANEANGELFGAYRIMKTLGEGAMGQVFLAQHTRLGRQVAIKVLRPELAGNKDLIARFFQEARAVNEIKNEHIVEIVDFVEEPNRVYTVMELLIGATLADTVKRDGPPTLRRAAAILRQVCEALEAAHQVGVVHRDVKPDNIFLVERTGQRDYVKVLDFGVAKLSRTESSSSQKTMQGTILGTPRYMSPEQAGGQQVDHRSDVYAVGTILYELLSGNAPFDGNTFGELAVKLITQKPPKLPEITPAGEKIPAAIRQLVARCLEKSPEKRPPSAAAVSEAMAPYAATGVTDDMALVLPRRRSGLAVAAVVGAIAVAAGLGWFVAGGHSSAEASTDPSLPVPSAPEALPAPTAAALPSGESAEPKAVKITLESDPTRVHVKRLDTGEDLGITPVVVKVPRDSKILLEGSLDGFESSSIEIQAMGDTTQRLLLKPIPAGAAASTAVAAKKKGKPKKANTVDPDDTVSPFGP